MKSRKSRTVTIAEPVQLDMSSLSQKRTEIALKVSETRKSIREILGKMKTFMSFEIAKTDGLMQQQLTVIEGIQTELVKLKKEREGLNREFVMIEAYKADLYAKDPKDLTLNEKQTCAKFINGLGFAEGVVAETLSKKHLQMLDKEVSRLSGLHKFIGPETMMEQALQFDERYLGVMKDFMPKMQQAMTLMTKRAEELNEGPLGELRQLKREFGQLQEESKLLIQAMMLPSIEPSVVDDEPEVSPLLKQHQALKIQLKEIISEIKEQNQPLDRRDAYLDIPLERDRVRAKIDLLRKMISELTPLKILSLENLAALTAALKVAEKDRQSQTLRAVVNIEDRAQRALEKISEMKCIAAYHDGFDDEIANAEKSITWLLLEIKPGAHIDISAPSRTSALIERDRRMGLDLIQREMWPLLEHIRSKNDAYLEKLDGLKESLETLSVLKQTRFPELAQLSDLDKLYSVFNGIPRPQAAQVIPMNKTRLRHLRQIVNEKLEWVEALEQQSLVRNNARETQIMQGMIDTVLGEKKSIVSQNPKDARIAILDSIQSHLQRVVDDYQHLKMNNPSTFIVQSIEIIHHELTKDALRQLTENGVIHPFVSFIRKLLEPVSWLIQKWQGQEYRANFFALPAEKAVALAAETALKSLNEELSAIVPVDAPTTSPRRHID